MDGQRHLQPRVVRRAGSGHRRPAGAADGQGALRVQGRATSRPTRNAERRVVLDDGIEHEFDKTGSPRHAALHHPRRRTSGSATRPSSPSRWSSTGATARGPSTPPARRPPATRSRRSRTRPGEGPEREGRRLRRLLQRPQLLHDARARRPRRASRNPVSADGTPNTVALAAATSAAPGTPPTSTVSRPRSSRPINALDSSVTGLMEIENSAKLGEAEDEATKTLVAALNKAAGRAKWDYVPSSDQLQPVADQDVITNAIIFQPAEVTWAGKAYADGKDATDAGPFGNARTPIAAAFTPVGGGAPMLVVVNHFKSKGSAPKDPADPNADQRPGRVERRPGRPGERAARLAARRPERRPHRRRRPRRRLQLLHARGPAGDPLRRRLDQRGQAEGLLLQLRRAVGLARPRAAQPGGREAPDRQRRVEHQLRRAGAARVQPLQVDGDRLLPRRRLPGQRPRPGEGRAQAGQGAARSR